MSDPSTSSPADRLDHLLASRPVTARPDFAGRVRARLHEDALDDAADLWIDHELARNVVQAPGDFAARVRTRINAGEGFLEEGAGGFRWRNLVPFAAAAALLFAVLSVSTTHTSEPVRIVSAERSVAPSSAPSTHTALPMDSFASAATTGVGSIQTFSAAPARLPMASGADRDLAKLLVLAGGLGVEARALLERPDIHSWLALAE